MFYTILSFLFYSSLLISTSPRVSIITSVYNADKYIEGFLNNITKQTIFADCELILINAASPGNEYEIIKTYLKRYKNITYIALGKDPGIYGVWNYALTVARADYITNANVDDRRNPESLEEQVAYLEQHPEIDLVYSDYVTTLVMNQDYPGDSNSLRAVMHDFSAQHLFICFPGPHPLWRKSIHAKYGLFDASFSSLGDLEMWNRAVSGGAVFKKLTGISGLYYDNPEGISTNQYPEKVAKRQAEAQRIIENYRSLWGSAWGS